MKRSDLIEQLAHDFSMLNVEDIDLAVKQIIAAMTETLAQGERIEVRGFGSFSVHYRKPRLGRNPKTGEQVALPDKYVPRFKPGKQLRERVLKGFGEN